MIEKRALQTVVAIAALVPLSMGAMSILKGAALLTSGGAVAGTDLDSHFRYVSGIFLGVGIAFVTCIPRLESKGRAFACLAALVVLGGLARLFSVFEDGLPSFGHRFGLVMELAVVPLIALCRPAWRGFAPNRVVCLQMKKGRLPLWASDPSNMVSGRNVRPGKLRGPI